MLYSVELRVLLKTGRKSMALGPIRQAEELVIALSFANSDQFSRLNHKKGRVLMEASV